MVKRFILALALLPVCAFAGSYPMNKTGTYVGNGLDWSRKAQATTTYYEVPTKTTVGGMTGSGSTATFPVQREIDVTPPKQYPHYPKGKIIEATKIPAPSVGKNWGKFAKNFGKFSRINPYAIAAGFALEWGIEKGWQWIEDDYSQWKDKEFPTGRWHESKPTSSTQQKMQDACWKGWGADKPGYSYNKAGPVIAHNVDTVTFTCHMYFASSDLGPLPAGKHEGVAGVVQVAKKTMSRYDMEWELRPVSEADFATAAQQYGDANAEKLVNTFTNAGWDWELDDGTQISITGQTQTDRELTSSTTTHNPDGSTTTTNTYQTNTYIYNNDSTINKMISPTSTRTTTETEVDGEITDTTTTETPTRQPGDSTDDSDDDEEPVTYDDPPFEAVPNLYDQKYDQGIKGVWDKKWPELQETGFMQSINKLIPSIGGGTCPRFEVGMDAGDWFSFGNQLINVPCWVFEAIRAIVMILAAFLARKIIWG